jgi:aspartyl-tRNA(Asn)/glutamyl-tRNA(Gln) amidotransferase subunit C
MKPRLDIDRVSSLASLCLGPEERADLAPQLEKIVGWVGALEKLDLPRAEEGPESHLDFPLCPRPDEVRESLPADGALSNAPDREPPFIKVPKVIEER